jgi:hypothetical protein
MTKTRKFRMNLSIEYKEGIQFDDKGFPKENKLIIDNPDITIVKHELGETVLEITVAHGALPSKSDILKSIKNQNIKNILLTGLIEL